MRHPRNTAFIWQQPKPPYELITSEQASTYRECGGFILANAFSKKEVEQLLTVLDPIEVEVNERLARVPKDQPSIARADEIVFSAHVVLRSAIVKTFAQHPIFAKLCHDLIGPRARLYWDQLVYKRPGTSEEFPWHQDNGYTFVEPQQYLTCWVALTDATPENGCPWIAPGQHLQGTLAHEWTPLGFKCLHNTPKNAQVMSLPAGSIAVFSSLTPHRTGPNLTAGTRKAYILQYAPDGALVYSSDGVLEPANDARRQFRMPLVGRR